MGSEPRVLPLHLADIRLPEGERWPPGHAPGHRSLVVESSAGTIVIAGQAVLTVAEWEGSTEPVDSGLPAEDQDDRDAYVASVGRLRALDPAKVHFVHDPAVWKRPA